MATTQNKITTISIRALDEQLTLIDIAAFCLKKTRTEFMLEVACQEAIKILLYQQIFLTNEESYNTFYTLLETPVAGNEALHHLLNQQAPWEN